MAAPPLQMPPRASGSASRDAPRRPKGWKPVSESDIHLFTRSGDPIPRGRHHQSPGRRSCTSQHETCLAVLDVVGVPEKREPAVEFEGRSASDDSGDEVPGVMDPLDDSQTTPIGDRAHVTAAVATSRPRTCPLASTRPATASWPRPRQLMSGRPGQDEELDIEYKTGDPKTSPKLKLPQAPGIAQWSLVGACTQ
ncbi:hypothetical protein MTO96_034664 [Rhipicephalus appendiculatus]